MVLIIFVLKILLTTFFPGVFEKPGDMFFHFVVILQGGRLAVVVAVLICLLQVALVHLQICNNTGNILLTKDGCVCRLKALCRH